ncbi:putative hydrocarbon binding protein [Neobacillus bataviensis]|uniref:Putative hydrocarbon binding protein n=1 Tax=Neobacillus bataviensis TaxID=220685 RepID=A0A561DGV7_9BACI|nr:putative hydrocarbon binding protein [Neobacillus bataviensis]
MKESTVVDVSLNTAENIAEQTAEPRTVSIFGYELIREILLPEILGKDTPEILYWAGKRLARKYPLADFDEVVTFFHNASWGQLEIKKETKNELEIELLSPLLVSRVKSKSEHFFQLEAGFLAQQMEIQKEVVAEAFEHPIKKGNKVQFTVKWDIKDYIE